MLKNIIIMTMAVATTAVVTTMITSGKTETVEAGNLERNKNIVYYAVGDELIEHTVVTDGNGNIVVDKMVSVNN